MTFATTVQNLPTQASNPLMGLENWAPLVGLLLGIAAIMALFTKHVTSKIADFRDAHKPVHDNIDAKLGELSHKLNGERMRVNGLETYRNQDIERIVKLETNLTNIEKSQVRIEHALDKMTVDLGNRIDHWSEEMSKSIREIRDVKPR